VVVSPFLLGKEENNFLATRMGLCWTKKGIGGVKKLGGRDFSLEKKTL